MVYIIYNGLCKSLNLVTMYFLDWNEKPKLDVILVWKLIYFLGYSHLMSLVARMNKEGVNEHVRMKRGNWFASLLLKELGISSFEDKLTRVNGKENVQIRDMNDTPRWSFPHGEGGIACLSRCCDWLLILKEFRMRATKHWNIYSSSVSQSVYVYYIYLSLSCCLSHGYLYKMKSYDATRKNKNHSEYRRWNVSWNWPKTESV